MRILLRGVASLLLFYVDCIRVAYRLALSLNSRKIDDVIEEDVCQK
jgi:hypothetical protein